MAKQSRRPHHHLFAINSDFGPVQVGKKTISERLNLLGVTDHVTVRRLIITENFFFEKLKGLETFLRKKIRGAKTFFITKFENSRLHFQKSQGRPA